VDKQTVPEFQQAAFSAAQGLHLRPGENQLRLSHHQVLDKESAHTKTFEEVRSTIEPILAEEKLNSLSNDVSAQMASAIRQSNRQSLDDLAKKFDLQIGETPAVPSPRRSASSVRHRTAPGALQLRPGELSSPLRVDRGFVVITPKDVLPAHAASLG